MVRHSRKNRKGGDKLDDIQVQVDIIQEQLNDLKGSRNSMPESMPESMPVSMVEESVKVDKNWVYDKNKKFKDGAGGRVALAFGRIITLIDNNIKRGDIKKEWSRIKEKLTAANSVDEVQDVIDENKVSFASNYVAGTRRKKRYGKKRTHRRR